MTYSKYAVIADDPNVGVFVKDKIEFTAELTGEAEDDPTAVVRTLNIKALAKLENALWSGSWDGKFQVGDDITVTIETPADDPATPSTELSNETFAARMRRLREKPP